MQYTNNNLYLLDLKSYDLKNLDINNFLGSSNEYYDYIFDIMKFVDEIIDFLFKNNTWEFTFLYNTLLSFDDPNNENRKSKIFTILYLLFKRLDREHHCINRLGIIINDNYDCIKITLNLIKEPQRSLYTQYDTPKKDNRQSGRSTRNANDIIQYAYNVWKENTGYTVNIVDHFTYEMMQNDYSMRGRRIYGNNQPNKILADIIRARIDNELPDCICKFIRITPNLEIYFDFPHIDKINYNAIS